MKDDKNTKKYANLSTEELKQVEASSNRLTTLMNRTDLNGKSICKKCELAGCSTIYPGNFSNYKHGKRKMTDEHLAYISQVLFQALIQKGVHYDSYIFMEYLSGKEPTCETYEEFEAIAHNSPVVNWDKYRSFLKHADFIVDYDDGFYSITNGKGETIETGYLEPNYSIYYNGEKKHLSPSEIEAYYQSLVKYLQDSFMHLKEGDADD